MTNTHGVEVAINELRDALVAWGIGVPFSLKRRDSREPGRTEKEAFEDELFAVFLNQFSKQKRGVRELLTSLAPDRKAIDYLDYLPGGFFTDEGFMAKVARILTGAIKHGIVLFDDAVGLTMDYTLTNAVAAKWASKYTFDLIKGINKTTRDVLQGIFKTFVDTPGMTIGDVVNLLPYTESRALMIATTETTRIYSQATQLAGEALKEEYPDVKVIVTWFTNRDDRVCELCQPLHGKEVELGKPFPDGSEGPPRHVGCLPRNTLVLPIGRVSAGSKRWYEDNVIVINTLENELTVTPNHPILTPSGWVSAMELKQGDYVLVYGAGERELSLIQSNKQDRETTIQYIFGSLDLVGFRVPTTAPDFHNDGAGSQVATIRTNRKIMNEIQPQFFEPLSQNKLFGRNVVIQTTFSTNGSMAQLSERGYSAFGDSVSGPDLVRSLLAGHSGPLDGFGFGPTARLDTSFQDTLSKSPTVDTRLFRQFLLRFAGNVAPQKVIKVRNEYFAGHVYNLQTESSLYVAAGIITHNCRCWTTTTTRLAR